MSRIHDLDFLPPRKIGVNARGISVGGRLTGSTGGTQFAPGVRRWPA